MKLLWLFLVINAVHASAQPGFGRSYLRNSRLCHQWSCLNTKLGLTDSLPLSEDFAAILRSLLPPDWHSVVDSVVNICYNDRPRRYSNTCPGQAIMHCAVDQLITFCPESYQRKGDACAPLSSLAGFKNMFTQSRYEDFETNMSVDRRPEWFLKNYFNQKCCNVPALFNSTTLSECGFSNFIQYYEHNPTLLSHGASHYQRHYESTTPPANDNGDHLQVVSLNDFLSGNTPLTTDPLDCCDISDFIQPSWREECNFELSWGGQRRLVVKSNPVTTTSTERPTTRAPITRRDITIVPQSCEKETCVFTKLNILANHTVDLDAFTRLLDNLTANHPSWTKGKGRVLTTCLRKPVTEYDGQCEINKLLSCTFDVLTENCPNTTKSDPCKHSSTSERTCQISSSKYRPKHRREICPLPDLIERSVLTECGLTSISRTEPVTTVIKPKTYKLSPSKNKCQDLSPSTSCLLSKMGVLNKYGFLDYFKMKDRIRNYSADKTPTLEGVLINAFNMDLLYNEHCNSPKKLLNLLDSMLMTCPRLKSRDTAQCSTIFDQINNSPIKRNVSQEYAQRILDHFLHVFNATAPNHKTFVPRHYRKIKKTPIYHYGILNDKHAPKVVTINVPPKVKPVVEIPKTVVDKTPLLLLPVYLREPHSNLIVRPFIENGVLRNAVVVKPVNITFPHTVSTTQTTYTTKREEDSTSTSESTSTTQRIYLRELHSNLIVRPFIENGVLRNAVVVKPVNITFPHTVSTTQTTYTTKREEDSTSTSESTSTTQRISTSAPHFSSRFVTVKNEKLEMLKPE